MTKNKDAVMIAHCDAFVFFMPFRSAEACRKGGSSHMYTFEPPICIPKPLCGELDPGQHLEYRFR